MSSEWKYIRRDWTENSNSQIEYLDLLHTTSKSKQQYTMTGTTTPNVPYFTLNNGNKMPALGLG